MAFPGARLLKVKKSTALISLVQVFGIALLGLASWNSVSASAASFDRSENCRPALWLEVKKLALDCSGQIEAGEKCEAIQFFKGQSASFRLRGHEYVATLTDSAFSDGGDLNDLMIRRDDGCELERTSVPAFGDLLKALAG